MDWVYAFGTAHRRRIEIEGDAGGNHDIMQEQGPRNERGKERRQRGQAATKSGNRQGQDQGWAGVGEKSKAQQAQANTRALLQTKQAHDRETPAWHALDAKSRGKAAKPATSRKKPR